EAMTGGIGEVVRDGEAIERLALGREQRLEQAGLAAEEDVGHGALRLQPGPHDVEDSRMQPARGLELVERDDHAALRPRGQRLWQFERGLEELQLVLLASELDSELDVLVS